MRRPLVGITVDLSEGRYAAAPACAALVREAGGLPVLLPCEPDCAAELLDCCDAVVLSGGDDPIMEPWGEPTHPKAKPLDRRRQAFELALLAALDERPQKPALGVCLGMQLMGLHRGGRLDQHLPDSVPTAADHWPKRRHAIGGELGEGAVHSHHRQALIEPGALRVVARAHDGLIEAVRDAGRDFYLGVQWHPERTDDQRLGAQLFRELVGVAESERGSFPS